MTVSGCKQQTPQGRCFLEYGTHARTGRAGAGKLLVAEGAGRVRARGSLAGRVSLEAWLEEMVRRERERSLGSECAALSTVLKRPAVPLS